MFNQRALQNDISMKTLALTGQSGKVALPVLLYMSVAFDTVDHKSYFTDLTASFVFMVIALRWLSSYLSGKIQSVEASGTRSSEAPLRYGMPHGSVLGSLFFILYISDLEDITEVHGLLSFCYAGDFRLLLL